MSVSAITGSQDLFGKTAADLQSGIAVDASGNFTGTLKYVSDYTGFSSKASEQHGNYLAVHAEVPGVDGVTITGKITKTSTLDADGDIVFIVTDKSLQMKFVASKEGYESVTKTFNLNGLTLESA